MKLEQLNPVVKGLGARRYRAWYLRQLAAMAVTAITIVPAFAQNYPNRPIRVITAPAGGGNDFPARLVARAISGPLEQQVIVDNRPSILVGEIVAKAPPDGYTLLVSGSALWIGPLVDKTNYDPIKDFSTITLIDRSPSLLLVHPSMPVNTVKQFIALAKAKPGELNLSVAAPGSSAFLGAVLFSHMAGVNIVRVPYKGTGQAVGAVLGGEVHAVFGSAGAATLHIKSQKLRALAVTSEQPSALAPGVPTVSASGVPGFVCETLHALFAPAGTPPAIVARLNQETTRYLISAEARNAFLRAGIEAAPGSPEDLTAAMRLEMKRLAPVLKAAGIGPS